MDPIEKRIDDLIRIAKEQNEPETAAVLLVLKGSRQAKDTHELMIVATDYALQQLLNNSLKKIKS